ncbi:hypothetical protein MTR_8g096720 [Medicago truncatula]|uniref:RNase H type-1 domain-containing protein n=1 Tax=Medicago truncatula TaxID=3880 RepID=A0A072TVW7_MEDTR|nr:hypothetical protein MTR_8g096720 [Medicago truncatula]
MNDPWVRGVQGSWIQSPQSHGVHSLSVSDLIDDENRVWDIDKIESLFRDDENQAILDTPLFMEVHNDRITWMMERNGRYTVRIGYKLAMKELLHKGVFRHDMYNVSRDVAGRVALLLWQIWVARNDVIWNDAHHTSTSIGRTTLDAWQQWQEVHKQPSPPVVQHGHNRVQGNNSVWEKPSETWLKCNVDAAFHERNHITTFACSRQFIRAQTKWQRANITVLEGEAVAVLEALRFADANR